MMPKLNEQTPPSIEEIGREFLSDRGIHFIIWGILVVAGNAFSYLLFEIGCVHTISYMWIAIYLAGFMFTFFMSSRISKKRIKTFAGKVFIALWLGITLENSFMYIIYLTTETFRINLYLAITSGFIAFGYLITGIMIRNKWFLFLAAVWTGGTLTMSSAPLYWTSALMGLMMFFFELIPGIIIYKLFNKSKSNHEING